MYTNLFIETGKDDWRNRIPVTVSDNNAVYVVIGKESKNLIEAYMAKYHRNPSSEWMRKRFAFGKAIRCKDAAECLHTSRARYTLRGGVWGVEFASDFLTKSGYRKHHSASRKGYAESGSEGQLEKYAGKFGEGYIMRCGSYRGSNTYESISYWIKED